MAIRAEDQGFTYSQLRTEIGVLLTEGDTDGLIALINAANVTVVENCAPELISVNDQDNAKSLVAMWNDYDTLWKAIDVAANINEVLGYFNSTSVNLAKMGPEMFDIVLSYESYSVASVYDYLVIVDAEDQLKDDNVC